MTAVASAVAWIDDRVNPIVVKELRQAVRSRFISGMFLFLLALELVSVWIYLLLASPTDDSLRGGEGLTGWLLGILSLACVLLVPAYTGIRMAWERSADQADLMFTTTIRAGAVIRGKLLTAVVIIALIYSASAPFILLTYLLRGVDVPTILGMLALTFVYALWATQLALLVGAIRTNPVAKVLLGLVAFLAVIGFGSATQAVMAIATMGPLMGPAYSGAAAPMWAYQAVIAVVTLAGTGLLYTLTVALLLPPSANRMWPTRVYVTALWIVSLIAAVSWWDTYGTEGMLIFWAIAWASLLSLGLLVAVSERDAWGPRVRRYIPRRPGRRLLAFLVYSGAACGLAWTICLAGLTLIAVILFGNVDAITGRDFDTTLAWTAGILLYGFAYGLTGSLARRLLFSRRVHLPHEYTWLLVLALTALGSLVPLFLVILVAYGTHDWSVMELENWGWLVTNPAHLAEPRGREVRFILLLLWTGAVALASVPWLLRQVGAFRPLEPEPPETQGAATHA